MPNALERKYPNAARAWNWQFAFPSSVERLDPHTGQRVRWHTSASTLQRTSRGALKSSGITKHATVRTFRHCFATHFLQGGCVIRTIQTLLGHKNIETTMIYTHMTPDYKSVDSPLDRMCNDY